MHPSIAEPLKVVQALFEQAGSPVAPGSEDWGVQAHFEQLLSDPSIRAQVPCLTGSNVDMIPINGLCSYRGMVQDTLDLEMYWGAYQRECGGWATTKYSDCLGEAPAAGSSAAQPQAAARAASKRGREVAAADSDAEAMELADSVQEGIKGSEGTEASTKASKVGGTDGGGANGMDAPASALPAPEEGDCLVYLYEAGERVHLNDVVEVYGVLSRVPELAQPHLAAGAAGAGHWASDGHAQTLLEEELAARQPTSLVPRLHAIAVVREADGAGASESSLRARAGELRGRAVGVLAAALGGDRFAAEYLLLQLVSRVYTRQDTLTVGPLSVSITGCPRSSRPPGAGEPDQAVSPLTAALQAAVAALVPRCVSLPLGVEHLNRATWRPAREHVSNRLQRSALQLPAHSSLLLDETGLAAGMLTAVGIDNLKAVKGLLELKSVDYGFLVYQLPMAADVPTTILSAGTSLLANAVDVVVPLHATHAPGASTAMAGDVLGEVRAWLAAVRRLNPRLDDAHVTAEIVAARSADPSLRPEQLHTWLLLARLLAASWGEAEVTPQRWTEMRAMEAARLERAHICVTSVKTG
ncbi:hypothetical protein WJX81_006299 [Elliptochloris bilobata]|uniref:Mini-chromosome maintenance complex-binding protein n=1 Tax=Elliptochloris bilobata TaxID=381761 RepID=A0AAW1S4F0_9CHLO